MSAENKSIDLRKQVINELRERQDEIYKPSSDINVVWVLSGPGTVLAPPNKGLYRGQFKDLERVEAGIEIVKKVTALRLGIEIENVTREDINSHGPVLLYNGEERGQGLYDQNGDLRTWVQNPDFPLPASNVVIQTLEEIYTPGQVKGLAEFLKDKSRDIKVAVVTHTPHLRRIGRNLERLRDLFLDKVEFEEACVPETTSPVGAVWGEIKRVVAYCKKGDLAESSIF